MPTDRPAGDDALAALAAELATIADRERTVGAWVRRHPSERVRSRLAAAPEGPLHGFTLGVKDIIDTFDLATERGSPIYAGRRPDADAACVALARAAGATVVGKTVTTELAALTPAGTRNPHHPARTPGGSSSGSAAAVAAGMVRVAFGTQTAGSVIRPAAFCGVVGFKPTHGLVPLTGVHPLAPSCDTLGWFARSVADAGAMLDALGPAAHATAADPASPPHIGVYRTHDWSRAEPEMVAALEGAARRLADAGATVIEVDPLRFLADAGSAQDAIFTSEAARALAWERQHHADQLSRGLRRLLERGDGVDAGAYAGAQQAATSARASYDTFVRDLGIDALLTPPAPGEAPGIETTGDPLFCRVWTLLGVPAVTLAAARGPVGLPVGVQLVGVRGRDHALLEVARFAEATLGA